jgi:hypothetical protein
VSVVEPAREKHEAPAQQSGDPEVARLNDTISALILAPVILLMCVMLVFGVVALGSWLL